MHWSCRKQRLGVLANLHCRQISLMTLRTPLSPKCSHTCTLRVKVSTMQVHQLWPKTFLSSVVIISTLDDDLCMNSDLQGNTCSVFYSILAPYMQAYRSLEVYRQYRASVCDWNHTHSSNAQVLTTITNDVTASHSQSRPFLVSFYTIYYSLFYSTNFHLLVY